jgi:hypothetical protein
MEADSERARYALKLQIGEVSALHPPYILESRSLLPLLIMITGCAGRILAYLKHDILLVKEELCCIPKF